MNALLETLPQKRAIGIHVGETEVTLCKLALGAMGARKTDFISIQVERRRLETMISDLLTPILASRQWREAPVIVGLPTLNVFFSTRPLKTQQCEATPQVLLHEMLRSSSLNIDDMEVDMIKHQINKNHVAGIVACQKRVMHPILEALKQKGVQPHQIEPGICGLLRLAVRRHKSPRRARSVLRVFLNERAAIAVLTAGDLPLLWRAVELESGKEAHSLYSLYRCVEKLAGCIGLESSPDAVMIHGRPDLDALADATIWGERTGPLGRFDGPSHSQQEISLGLAMGASSAADTFNLARKMRPPMSTLRRVPLGQVVVQGTLMAAGGLFLAGNLTELDSMASSIATERSSIPWLKDQSVAKLQAEKVKLSDRLEVIRGFVGGRILWSAGIREVAEGLPGEMTLSSIEGRCEYHPDSKGNENSRQSKRSLIATVEAPIPKGEAIPREIDSLVNRLRSNPKIREDLPTVELGTLRWGVSGTSKAATASFTVVCLPKSQAPAPKNAPAAH